MYKLCELSTSEKIAYNNFINSESNLLTSNIYNISFTKQEILDIYNFAYKISNGTLHMDVYVSYDKSILAISSETDYLKLNFYYVLNITNKEVVNNFISQYSDGKDIKQLNKEKVNFKQFLINTILKEEELYDSPLLYRNYLFKIPSSTQYEHIDNMQMLISYGSIGIIEKTIKWSSFIYSYTGLNLNNIIALRKVYHNYIFPEDMNLEFTTNNINYKCATKIIIPESKEFLFAGFISDNYKCAMVFIDNRGNKLNITDDIIHKAPFID